MIERAIRVTVNGRVYERTVEARKTLADFLRDDLELTGTHLGCEHGVCGACTIIVDGAAVRSCLLFAAQAHGRDGFPHDAELLLARVPRPLRGPDSRGDLRQSLSLHGISEHRRGSGGRRPLDERDTEELAMRTMTKGLVLGLATIVLWAGGPPTGRAAEEITLLATVTRVVNLPMIVGLRLLEREDGIKVTVKDLRSPEAVMLAVIEGQGQVATGFAPFYPAVEKGALVKGVMELSRPEFVVMAKKEIGSVKELNGVRLASHSPKATVQSLLEFYLKSQPGIQPNVVFIPEGSPARAEALLRGAVDAAAFDLTAAQVVNERAPNKFHVLVDFTNQPVSSSSLVVNPDFARKNPALVQKLVRRLLQSYREGARDPKFWVRERGETMKEVDDAKLESQLRALVKIFDLNGGLDRMKGPGAVENLSFQVTTGNLTGPVTKWKPEQFFDTAPLEAVLKDIGRR